MSSIWKEMKVEIPTSVPKVQLKDVTDRDSILAAIRQQMKVKIAPPVPKIQGVPVSVLKIPEMPDHPKYLGSNTDLSDIKRIVVNRNLREHEVEASFGRYMKQFYRPGVTVQAFNNITSYLEKQVKEGNMTKIKLSDTVEIMDYRLYPEEYKQRKDYKNLRHVIFEGKGDWEQKQRFFGGWKYNGMKKETKGVIDLKNWGVRVSIAKESAVDVDDNFKNEVWKPTLIRKRDRITYVGSRSFRGLKLDLTIIREYSPQEEHKMKCKEKKYEVEIEILSRTRTGLSKDAEMNAFINAIQNLYALSVGVSPDNQKIIPYKVISMTEREAVIQLHNNLFWKTLLATRQRKLNRIKDQKFKSEGERRQAIERAKIWTPMDIWKNFWNRPENIKLENLFSPKGNWAVTVKLNGVRSFLLIGNYGIYRLEAPRYIVRAGDGIKEYNGTTLVDGEYFINPNGGKEYHGFDIVFYQGKDLRQEKFTVRLKYLNMALEDIKAYDTDIIIKKYFMESLFHREEEMEVPPKKEKVDEKLREKWKKIAKSVIESDIDIIYPEKDAKRERRIIESTHDLYYRTNLAFDYMNEKYPGDQSDGLIFQPFSGYKNIHTFKWKPPHELTIDFCLSPITGEGEAMLREKYSIDEGTYLYRTLVGGWGRSDIVFKGKGFKPYKGFVVLNNDSINGQSLADQIVECVWDGKDFIPRRIRIDRDRPNGNNTAMDVWLDIHNPIEQGTIRGDSLQMMRKFHNRRKLLLLKQVFQRGDTILDIGSGRGGDISKWNRAGLGKVYAVEPNNKFLKEFKKRLENRGSKGTDIVIVNTGAQNTEEIEAAVKDKLDGIVSFFSLTFFPRKPTSGEPEDTYAKLLDTINLLPPNGKFLGIVMDGDKTLDLLEKSKEYEDYEDYLYYDASKKFIDSSLNKEVTAGYIIEQESTFADFSKPGIDNYLGNEIKMKIFDETSMVDYNEFLFFFPKFRADMELMGFRMIKEGFLDTGQQFDRLPKQSKVLSALNRFFVFERVEKEVSLKSIESRTAKDDTNTLYFSKIKESNSSFVHAILLALDKKYSKMSEGEQEKYAQRVRRRLAKKLTMDIFKELHGGELAKRLQYPEIKKHGKADAMEIAWLERKLKIVDSKQIVGEVSLLEIASAVYEVNIFVLTDKYGTPSRLYSKQCNELYSHPKSIVLLLKNIDYYDLVGKQRGGKITNVFNSNDAFIKRLKRRICPPKVTKDIFKRYMKALDEGFLSRAEIMSVAEISEDVYNEIVSKFLTFERRFGERITVYMFKRYMDVLTEDEDLSMEEILVRAKLTKDQYNEIANRFSHYMEVFPTIVKEVGWKTEKKKLILPKERKDKEEIVYTEEKIVGDYPEGDEEQ